MVGLVCEFLFRFATCYICLFVCLFDDDDDDDDAGAEHGWETGMCVCGT
jgi:hypothetical protein